MVCSSFFMKIVKSVDNFPLKHIFHHHYNQNKQNQKRTI